MIKFLLLFIILVLVVTVGGLLYRLVKKPKKVYYGPYDKDGFFNYTGDDDPPVESCGCGVKGCVWGHY